jgi:hypothetical protein
MQPAYGMWKSPRYRASLNQPAHVFQDTPATCLSIRTQVWPKVTEVSSELENHLIAGNASFWQTQPSAAPGFGPNATWGNLGA